MPISGAVNIGLNLGEIASNYIFNYTKSDYEKKINELDTHLNALQGHLADMKGLRGQVYQFWEDDNARTVCGELDRTILQTEREMETVRAFLDTLRITVSELDSSNAQIQQTIDDLRALLTLGISG